MKKGFTLVELMIVVAIIGILAGMLVPVVSKIRGKTHEAPQPDKTWSGSTNGW